jgi:hypothetical protein
MELDRQLPNHKLRWPQPSPPFATKFLTDIPVPILLVSDNCGDVAGLVGGKI